MKKLATIAILVLILSAGIYWVIRDRRSQPGDGAAGMWDKDRALELATQVLEATDWKSKEGFCSGQECKPVHELYGDFPISLEGKEKRILATTSIAEGSDCHACGPEVSLFEFEPGPDGWILTDSDVDVVRWGQWGKLGPNELQIIFIGKNAYGARLDGGSTGQGITIGNTSIYAHINGDYREVFSVQTAENDESSKTSWGSVVSLQPGNGEFYDVLVERKGTREGLPVSERELFKFDGDSYQPDPH